METSRKILNDVFGYKVDEIYHEGLVDVMNVSDFEVTMETLVDSWRKLPLTTASNMEKFITWFVKNKKDVICDTMLRGLREECGLGNPPSVFTTNGSEV
jgi:hypothetical protein